MVGRDGALDKRKKENGLAWAAKMRVPHHEEFWAKWDALPAECQLFDPPPEDGRRCPLCKRKLYFLESNHMTYKQCCDGCCTKDAGKIVTTFGLDRHSFTGTTAGADKRPPRHSGGMGAKPNGKAKGGLGGNASFEAQRGGAATNNKQGKAARQPANC